MSNDIWVSYVVVTLLLAIWAGLAVSRTIALGWPGLVELLYPWFSSRTLDESFVVNHPRSVHWITAVGLGLHCPFPRPLPLPRPLPCPFPYPRLRALSLFHVNSIFVFISFIPRHRVCWPYASRNLKPRYSFRSRNCIEKDPVLHI